MWQAGAAKWGSVVGLFFFFNKAEREGERGCMWKRKSTADESEEADSDVILRSLLPHFHVCMAVTGPSHQSLFTYKTQQ